MKFLLLNILTITTLFSTTISLANQENSFNVTFENLVSKLATKGIELTLYNNTKIYKQNGALLGLMKKKVDLAVVKNSFLQDLIGKKIEAKAIEELNFSLLKQGEKYSLIVHKSFYGKYSKQTIDDFLDIIDDELKDF